MMPETMTWIQWSTASGTYQTGAGFTDIHRGESSATHIDSFSLIGDNRRHERWIAAIGGVLDL
jgi:hypothetical protein